MSNNGNRKRKTLPPSGRPGKVRKPRKNLSEDEDSNDSLVSDQVQEPQREPSPLPDEPTEKLPEASILIIKFHLKHLVF